MFVCVSVCLSVCLSVPELGATSFISTSKLRYLAHYFQFSIERAKAAQEKEKTEQERLKLAQQKHKEESLRERFTLLASYDIEKILV